MAEQSKILGQGDSIEWGDSGDTWETKDTPSGYEKTLKESRNSENVHRRSTKVKVKHSDGKEQTHEVRKDEKVTKRGDDYTFPR